MMLPRHNNQKGRSHHGIWDSPSLVSWSKSLHWRRSHILLPACLLFTAFARLDINSRLVLVNYWICCHYNLDNCTTDLYLLLYCYLEINCLSLKLLGWCLLLYPEAISRQGCYEPLHCPNSGMMLFPASSSPGTEGFCSSQPRENPT